MNRTDWDWHPFSVFDRLHNRMLHLMDQMLGGSPTRLKAGEEIPRLNMYKEQENLIIEAALPGIDKDDIKVHATRDSVTISGETRREAETKEKEYHREWSYGSYTRSVRLPVEVDPDKITAKMQDGILKLTLPMLEPERHQRRQINIE